MAIAPGIAVTNGHNRNLVDPGSVIGEAKTMTFYSSATRTRPSPKWRSPSWAKR